MSTPAHIAHQTKGRIRIEIPGKRGDEAYFAELSEQVARSAQVRRTRGNPPAASLVVEYAGCFDDLVAALNRSDLDLASPATLVAGVSQSASDSATLPTLPHLVNGFELNSMFMAGAAFGVVGIVQTLRGEVMLPALSAFWYAANALRLARAPLAADGTTGGATEANSTLP